MTLARLTREVTHHINPRTIREAIALELGVATWGELRIGQCAESKSDGTGREQSRQNRPLADYFSQTTGNDNPSIATAKEPSDLAKNRGNPFSQKACHRRALPTSSASRFQQCCNDISAEASRFRALEGRPFGASTSLRPPFWGGVNYFSQLGIMVMELAMVKYEIRWLDLPRDTNYPAAQSCLTLCFPEKVAKALVKKLKAAPITTFKAKDIFRASRLSLLSMQNKHVDADVRKIEKGEDLSPPFMP
jgi:hypothetical protein